MRAPKGPCRAPKGPEGAPRWPAGYQRWNRGSDVAGALGPEATEGPKRDPQGLGGAPGPRMGPQGPKRTRPNCWNEEVQIEFNRTKFNGEWHRPRHIVIKGLYLANRAPIGPQMSPSEFMSIRGSNFVIGRSTVETYSTRGDIGHVTASPEGPQGPSSAPPCGPQGPNGARRNWWTEGVKVEYTRLKFNGEWRLKLVTGIAGFSSSKHHKYVN